MAQSETERDAQGRVSPATEPSSKKRFNLKDELSEVQQLMDSSLPTAQQLELLHKKYMSLVRDYKRSDRRLAESHRKQLEIAQHRDIVQNEYARLNVAKGKLETLCRELQKHNKQVVEESKQRTRLEEDKRREVSDRFQSTITDVTTRMQEQQQENQTLKAENLDITEKLKQLLDQFEAREKQFESAIKHNQLELQLLEAKLAQQTVAMAEAKENNLAERQFLLAETLLQQKRCEELTAHEADLREQLALYSDKFEEFQKTLTKSNELFGTFRKESDKLSKKITSLEKENHLLKARNETYDKNILEMTEERLRDRETMNSLKSKNERLERLCRAMQTERSSLNKQLKEERERRAKQDKEEKDEEEEDKRPEESSNTDKKDNAKPS